MIGSTTSITPLYFLFILFLTDSALLVGTYQVYCGCLQSDVCYKNQNQLTFAMKQRFTLVHRFSTLFCSPPTFIFFSRAHLLTPFIFEPFFDTTQEYILIY